MDDDDDVCVPFIIILLLLYSSSIIHSLDIEWLCDHDDWLMFSSVVIDDDDIQ